MIRRDPLSRAIGRLGRELARLRARDRRRSRTSRDRRDVRCESRRSGRRCREDGRRQCRPLLLAGKRASPRSMMSESREVRARTDRTVLGPGRRCPAGVSSDRGRTAGGGVEAGVIIGGGGSGFSRRSSRISRSRIDEARRSTFVCVPSSRASMPSNRSRRSAERSAISVRVLARAASRSVPMVMRRFLCHVDGTRVSPGRIRRGV